MLIDITMEISQDLLPYPGDPKTIIEEYKSMENDGFSLSYLKIGLHTATHIDFPSHFIKDGKKSENFYDLNYFTGITAILDIFDFSNKTILPKNVDSVFLKTNNTPDLTMEYNAINRKQLDCILKRRYKFLGVDFLTVEPKDSEDFYFHKQLLSNNILILENLNLKNIKNGIYKYHIFPLKIKGTEASLVRIAVEELMLF